MSRMTDPTSQGTTQSIQQIIGNQQYADAPRVEERQLKNQMTLQQQQGDIQSQQYAALNESNMQRDLAEQQARMAEMRERDRLDRERIDLVDSKRKAASQEWKNFLKEQQAPLTDVNAKIASNNSEAIRVQHDLDTDVGIAAVTEDQFRAMQDKSLGLSDQLVQSLISQGTILSGAVGEGLGDLVIDAGITSEFQKLFQSYDEPLVPDAVKTALAWTPQGRTIRSVVAGVKMLVELASGNPVGNQMVQDERVEKGKQDRAESLMKAERNVVGSLGAKIGAQIDQKLGTGVGPKVARLMELHYLAASSLDDAAQEQLIGEARQLVGAIEMESGNKINSYALDQAFDQVIANLVSPDSLDAIKSQSIMNKQGLDSQGLTGAMFDEGGKQEASKRFEMMKDTFERIGRKMAQSNPLIIEESSKQTPEKVQAHLSMLMKKMADASPAIRAEVRDAVDADVILNLAKSNMAAELRTLLKGMAATKDENEMTKARIKELKNRLEILNQTSEELKAQRESLKFDLTAKSPAYPTAY